jgi:uncharacterized protein (TIGR00730 family)
VPYEISDPELNERILRLVADAADGDNQDLIAEMITTVIKLHRDHATRGDLKLINTALKEMRYSNLVFSRHKEPKVTIFGSARLREDDPNYQLAERFAAEMVAHGWGVITGAGPGIMEAGSRGAGPDAAYGVSIRLPFETHGNEYIRPERMVNFKYFFTRKLGFVKESHAFAIFPGGWGTLDEAFELLTLIQTGKSDMHPIVLIEAEETGFWGPLIGVVRDVQAKMGLISPDDLALFLHTTSTEEACAHIRHFYSNYHSQRYVNGKLVLRLRRAPTDDQLAELTEEFRDILVDGVIERVDPSPAEIEEKDVVDLERIALHFDRRRFGRLRRLIDRLNDLAALPDTTELPAPMTEEMAERPW